MSCHVSGPADVEAQTPNPTEQSEFIFIAVQEAKDDHSLHFVRLRYEYVCWALSVYLDVMPCIFMRTDEIYLNRISGYSVN